MTVGIPLRGYSQLILLLQQMLHPMERQFDPLSATGTRAQTPAYPTPSKDDEHYEPDSLPIKLINAHNVTAPTSSSASLTQ